MQEESITVPNAFSMTKVRSTGRYRLTFDPTLLSKLLEQDAEAFALSLAKLKNDLKSLGRDIFLDPDNRIAFDDAVKARPDGVWVSRHDNISKNLFKIKTHFISGFLQDSSMSFEEYFDLVSEFFLLIDRESFASASPEA
jgi:hypothetical protein